MAEQMEELYESSVDIKNLDEEQDVILDEEDIFYSDDIKVISSENPYVLGRLAGTFMVMEEDNGNGRWYPVETVKTRIVDLPYTKKMIANKSLLGECHHPMGERTNIWMDESCISTTKLEVRGNRLYGEADILDTPKGRIVNTLARYGTNIGVSARATGKGTKRGGHLVITPDKYFFKTFDAVLNPGFEASRPKKLEPNNSPMRVYEEKEDDTFNLYEEIKNQIEQNKCDEEMLDYFINYTKDESLKSLKKLFEDVTTDNVLENKEEISMSEVEDLQKKVEDLEEENNSLKRTIQNLNADLDSMNEEKSNYNERLDFLNEESCKSQQVADSQIVELLDVLSLKEEEVESLTEELSNLKEEIESLRFNYAGLSSRLLNANEEQKESSIEINSLREQVHKLEEELNEEASQEEPVKEVREKVIPKEVNLFEESIDSVNKEPMEELNKSNLRLEKLVGSLGGKR